MLIPNPASPIKRKVGVDDFGKVRVEMHTDRAFIFEKIKNQGTFCIKSASFLCKNGDFSSVSRYHDFFRKSVIQF